MKIEEKILNNYNLNYPLEKIASLSDILFLDIETTGFLSGSSQIYLIGCAYYSEENWTIKQFFASDSEEEEQIVSAFLEFASSFNFLIHYNGNTFDLPFIKAKAEKYNISYPFESMNGLDIYRRITPYKNLLKITDCKLKTIEEFLGIERIDQYSGGELINVYKDYLSSHDYDLYHTLLQHNFDDMKGMFEVLPILSYYDLFNNPVTATKVSASHYNDINGISRQELMINFSFESSLKKTISFMGQGCHLRVEGNQGTLVVPIYEEELKYFYANYKDYYYLPTEDQALHKSIASYVDKEFRQQAQPENCYTRKISRFLPQWSVLVEPFFKRDYYSTDLFFELNDDVKKDRQLFNNYVSHIMNKIAFQK